MTEPAGARLLEAAARAAETAEVRAAELDVDGAFPSEDVQHLHAQGLLAACIPALLGGAGLGSDRLGSPELLGVLRRIGRGSLALGRLYEGHVNAWQLVAAFGNAEQQERLAADTRAGAMLAVWNTGPPEGLWLEPKGHGFRLRGSKSFASGTGHILRPLVTAREPEGGVRMIVVRLEPEEAARRADLSSWRAQGMRASASGSFDFTGLDVEPSDVIGEAGDYEREPAFTAGAWRFAAVHLGGIEALAAETMAHLRRTSREGDPLQASRIGELALAVESARLWLERAALLAEAPMADPKGLMAYVRLARLAVERAGLDTVQLAQRAIGVQAFLRPHPVERIGRDLATYLRQPAPDRALLEAAGHVARRAAAGEEPWPCR